MTAERIAFSHIVQLALPQFAELEAAQRADAFDEIALLAKDLAPGLAKEAHKTAEAIRTAETLQHRFALSLL